MKVEMYSVQTYINFVHYKCVPVTNLIIELKKENNDKKWKLLNNITGHRY